MTRKRFKPTERAAFLPKTEIEWLNGSHWRSGVITTEIQVDSLGSQYVGIINRGTARTVSDGDYLRGYPKRIRLPQSTALPDSPTSERHGHEVTS